MKASCRPCMRLGNVLRFTCKAHQHASCPMRSDRRLVRWKRLFGGLRCRQDYAPAVRVIQSSITRSASPMFPIWQWFWADSALVKTRSVSDLAFERS
jgi:hypothetical protein